MECTYWLLIMLHKPNLNISNSAKKKKKVPVEKETAWPESWSDDGGVISPRLGPRLWVCSVNRRGPEHTALGCSGVQHYSCDCRSAREELRHPVAELHVGDCGFQISFPMCENSSGNIS